MYVEAMKKAILLAMLILVLSLSAVNADSVHYVKRLNITTNALVNQTIFVNHTFANITGGNILVTDFNNVTVPYQTLIKGFWRGQNISAQWQTSNYTVIFVTTANCCFVWYQNNTENDNSTSILIRKDDFESYTLGVKAPFTGGNANSVIVSSSGQKGFGNNNDTNPLLTLTTTAPSGNLTVWLELNSTDFDAGANNLINEWHGTNGTNLYRIPQDTSEDVYKLQYFDGVTTAIGNNTAGVTFNFNRAAINITTYRDDGRFTNILGNSVSGIISHMVANDNNITSLGSIELTFGGGMGASALLQYEIYNRTVYRQYADPTITFDGVATFTPPDTTPPVVTLIHPANATTTNQTLNITYTITDETAVGSCVYSVDGAANVSALSCGNFTNVATLSIGAHNVRVCGNDTSGNIGCAQNFFTVADATNPTVIIISPTNSTITSTNITLTYTVSDNGVISQCVYRLDGGANVSLTTCQNTSFIASNGTSHSLQVCANDTSANIGCTTRTFTVNTTVPPPPTTTNLILQLFPLLLSIGALVIIVLLAMAGKFMEAAVTAIVAIFLIIILSGAL